MLAPSLFGLVVVGFAALGETVVRPPRPAGARTASLETRRIRDYLPRPLTWLVGCSFMVLAGTLALTTATASRDELHGTLRQLACEREGMSSTSSPYPGSHYSLPLAAVLLAILLVAVVACLLVVRRPRGLAPTEADDDRLRVRSVTVVVAATGVAVCATLAGIALVTGGALRGVGRNCGPAWMEPLGQAYLAVTLVAAVATLWCVVRLISNDRLGSR